MVATQTEDTKPINGCHEGWRHQANKIIVATQTEDTKPTNGCHAEEHPAPITTLPSL